MPQPPVTKILFPIIDFKIKKIAHTLFLLAVNYF